jgi:hypothetical protein
LVLAHGPCPLAKPGVAKRKGDPAPRGITRPAQAQRGRLGKRGRAAQLYPCAREGGPLREKQSERETRARCAWHTVRSRGNSKAEARSWLPNERYQAIPHPISILRIARKVLCQKFLLIEKSPHNHKRDRNGRERPPGTGSVAAAGSRSFHRDVRITGVTKSLTTKPMTALVELERWRGF